MTEAQPVVSIVVPTRNRAALLTRLLAALDRQEYSRYEVVVVDDGSTDDTPSVLARWAGEGRLALRTETGGGSYAARNRGWRASSGTVIAFTDDDCIPAPGWISGLVAALAGDSVGAQGQTLAEPGEWTPFTHQIDQRSPGPPYRTCNIAYRRATLEGLGGFDESFRWYADNILGLRARKRGAIAWAPDAIVRHPPRPREWRDVDVWIARFDADTRHRAELRRLRAEPISPPPSVLPIVLWVLRPLMKQSLAHLRFAARHPIAYARNLLPLVRDKAALLAALRLRYAPSWTERPHGLPPLPACPLVSIVVVTRARPALLMAALDALRRQTWERREIIVVDHDGSLTSPGADIRLIAAPDTTLGAARQRGVDAATGDIVAFTDDDCLPDPDWIARLVAGFRAHETWLGAQGRTVAAPGPVGSHAVRLSRPGSLYQTCNIAYRRDALRLAGGFDPQFVGWFEDTALGARVLAQGPIGFVDDAVVVHQAVPRRPMDRAHWSVLLGDEERLAACYGVFYRRRRGIGVLPTVIARWLIGSSLKTLLRELPGLRSDPRGYARLVRSLLVERWELIRALRSRRESSAG